MPVTTIAGRAVHVDDEGFLTAYEEWDPGLANNLAGQIGIDLTEAHWKVLGFLREDYAAQGETATLRRVTVVGGIPPQELFGLFPKKPAKKMAYIARLPTPPRRV